MSSVKERGKCLTCPYMHCEGRVAWCHRQKNMRIIFETHYSDFAREEMDAIFKNPKEIKHLQMMQRAKTINQLAKRVNPSWCYYRTGVWEEKGEAK